MIKQFKDLVTSVDVLNTLHGGISEPFLSINEQPYGREIRVRVPGVEKEMLRVEIIDNNLSIFYFIPMNSNGTWVKMPQIVYSKAIPYFVDAGKIEAIYEDRDLVVQLPFNELSNGYNRKIKIQE